MVFKDMEVNTKRSNWKITSCYLLQICKCVYVWLRALLFEGHKTHRITLHKFDKNEKWNFRMDNVEKCYYNQTIQR